MTQENEKLISVEDTQPEETKTPGGNSRALPPFIPIIRPDDPIDPGDPEDPDEPEAPEETAIIGGDFVKNGADLQDSFGVNASFNFNLYKGKLFFTQHLFTAEGLHLPASFSATYNNRFADTDYVHGQTTMFKGWKLNYQQFIRFADNKCVYVDGAFKEHVFEKSTNNANVYLDVSTQSGTILRPATDEETFADYVITDGANTKLFFKNNRLVKIRQTNGATPVETTITYDALNRVTQVTDGLGNTYSVNYVGDTITITDSANVVLATLTADSNNRLATVKYYEDDDHTTTKKCLFGYNSSTHRLLSVEDQLALEKVSFEYNTYGKLTALRKYASKDNVDTPLQSVFLTYSTASTIISKNNGTDANMSQIRYRYTFHTDGSLKGSCEIDSSGNSVVKETQISHSNGVEKQSVFTKKNKITWAEESSPVSVGPGVLMYDGVEIGRKTFTLPNYYQGKVDVQFSWAFTYEDWNYIPEEEDKKIIFEIFVNNFDYPIATKEYTCEETLSITDFFEVADFIPSGNLSVMLKVTPPATLGLVTVTNASVQYATTTTKQLRIRYTPPHDIIFANPVYVTEYVDNQPQHWFPVDGISFQTSAGTITPSVFSLTDYQQTMISYFRSPSSFNLYYNDGAKVAYGISFARGIFEDFEAEWENLPFAIVTTSSWPQMFEHLTIVEENLTDQTRYLKLSQREVGKSDERSYTKLDDSLRTVEEYKQGETTKAYTYDCMGNVIEKSTAGMLESYTFSDDGQFVVEVDSHIQDQSKTIYGYCDTTKMLDSIKLPLGAFVKFGYKDRNILTSVRGEIDNVTVAENNISYDGAFVTQLTHNDTTFAFTYDSRNNVNSVKVDGATLLTKEMNFDEENSGNYSIKLTYGNGYTVKNYYDKYDRLVRVSSVSGTSETKLATYMYADEKIEINNDFDMGDFELGDEIVIPEITYEPNYLATSASLLQMAIDEVTGLVYTYTYDEFGTCTKVEVGYSGTSEQELVKTFTYDTFGRVSQQQTSLDDTTIAQINTYANDFSAELERQLIIVDDNIEEALFYGNFFKTEYARDNQKRPDCITRTVNDVEIQQDYTYRSCADSNGTTPLVAQLTTRISTGKTQQHTVDYDANGNIIQYGNVTYEYDDLNRLTRENNPTSGINKTFTWTYDAGGNIASKKTYRYTVGSLNELYLAETQSFTYGSTWKDQLTSFNGNTITYDRIGNPLKYGSKTFSWVRGRLLSKVVNGSQTVNFYYDATGRRTQKSIGTTHYEYLYDGDKLLQMSVQTPGSWDHMTFAYDAQGVIGFNYKGKNYIYVRNLFGDITDIYCEDHCVAKYTYDAWGNCVAEDLSGIDEDSVHDLNPFRYRGYVFDEETNLYYCNSRYYSPEWGRFINADTLDYLDPESINGLNLYAYCYNNPIMFADPSGCSSIGIFFITMAIASILYWGISAACGEQFAGGVGSISSGATAISTGISLCAFGFIGAVAGLALIVVGGFTIAFGVNEIADSLWGTNYIQDWTGWSDDVYNNVYMGLNIASAIGSIAGNIGMKYVANIKLNNIMSDPQSVQKLNRFKFKTYARYSDQWNLSPCKNGKGMRALSNIKKGNAIRYGYGIYNEEHFWGAYYWIVSNGNKFRFPFK